MKATLALFSALFYGLILCSVDLASANWFNPNRPDGSLSAADSLAAFRPDSLAVGQINRLESGIANRDTAKAKADSVKRLTSAQLFSQRTFYLALHAGVGFQDLNGRENFAVDLESRARNRLGGGRILQPYEPVPFYFPGGVLAGLRLFNYADAVFKTHSFWYKQSGLIGDSLSGTNGQEEFYALQGHLAGVGMRLYIPQEILSERNYGHIYLEVVRYWDIVPAEIYTAHGSAEANRSAAGSGTEFQAGFMHSLATRWTWGAALSFFSSNWESSTRWNELLQVTQGEAMQWGGNALQLRFFLFFNPSLAPGLAEKPEAQAAKP